MENNQLKITKHDAGVPVHQTDLAASKISLEEDNEPRKANAI